MQPDRADSDKLLINSPGSSGGIDVAVTFLALLTVKNKPPH